MTSAAALPCSDLSAFADGELEPERAAVFRAHLPSCEACQRGLIETQQLAARLTTMPKKPRGHAAPPAHRPRRGRGSPRR